MNYPLVPIDDIEKMATAMENSKLYNFTKEESMGLMLIAQAEGLHPVAGLRDYNIIKGKPSLTADAMLGRFQSAGGTVDWVVFTSQEVRGKFKHPSSESSLEIGWTLDDAAKAGLGGSNTWKQYPRSMLRARVVSEAVRAVFPSALNGMYTEEEIEDFDTDPPDEKLTNNKSNIYSAIPSPKEKEADVPRVTDPQQEEIFNLLEQKELPKGFADRTIAEMEKEDFSVERAIDAITYLKKQQDAVPF